MKTIFLTFIAIAGLLILGGLALLAFHKGDVAQTEFEREITPASAAAPASTPVQAAPALVVTPQTVVETTTAPTQEVTSATEEAPTTGAIVTETAPASAPADEDTVPLPAVQ